METQTIFKRIHRQVFTAKKTRLSKLLKLTDDRDKFEDLPSLLNKLIFCIKALNQPAIFYPD